ncbi:DUF6384 family protein [Kangiella sp. TOML190]|uniref:DUF6384 family protein n=1 Tax=Kangiella sp. TOML190 TaxID=2931351 RepID=UPI00203DCE9A|nr:DUF6384 family protein [Kangiella sp. TOML190]
MAENTNNKHDIPLSDVMLAMDIADTIRHRDRIVEQELSEAEREKALFEKVKRTYASQGIEVSDATIKEAIQAIEDERFTYQAPKASFFTKLAHIYINRGKWAKGFAALLAITGLAWLISWAVFTLPKQMELNKQANALNQSIIQANTSEESLQSRLDGLVKELNRASEPQDSELKGLYQRQKQNAFQLLKTAATHIDVARPLRQQDDFDGDEFKKAGALAMDQVDRQEYQLGQAKAQLDKAETAIKRLHQINLLPNELQNLYSQAKDIARSPRGQNLANNYYQNGLAAIKGFDFDAANNVTSDLKDLIENLQQSYQLQIVYRHGEQTGLWREPEINQSARNYYIIVEAIDKNGQALTLPIVNEETGKVSRVKKWALRVERAVFDQIARDKRDDGIVQNNIFGSKAVGVLEVDYRFPTTGKAITRW